MSIRELSFTSREPILNSPYIRYEIRLLITTYYADRAAELVLEGILPSQIRREQRLWFL